jgi:hypothetical protein
MQKADIEKLNRGLAMGGIGLQIGVGADLKLEFSDADEIREHPMASQFAEHTFGMI